MKLPVFILVHDGTGNPVYVKFDQIVTLRESGNGGTLLLTNGQTVGLLKQDAEQLKSFIDELAAQADGQTYVR
jgi:hypothetical protein